MSTIQTTSPLRLYENLLGTASDWMGLMNGIERKYASGEIDRAGKILSSMTTTPTEQEAHAIEVMDNWRLSHAYPMEMARKTLEARAKTISHNPTFGTRLKTESSIRAKLMREKNMKLSTMQDIGGCRVIVRDMEEVNRIVDLYAKDSDIKIDDYVKTPRVSGYRGNHIIWRFNADDEAHSCYNNMRIEIQIRTELQHSWATAVEVCSTFTDQNLKSDHPVCKDPRWVRFFALMGSAMAINEGGGAVRETPSSKSKLLSELGKLVDGLKVTEVMDRWNTATQIISSAKAKGQAHNFLIELQAFDHFSCRVNVTPFEQGREQEASAARVRRETEARRKPGVQVALVGVQSVDTLKTAYPNYFSDTSRFVKELEMVLRGRTQTPFPISTITPKNR